MPAFDATVDQNNLAVSFGLFPSLWQLLVGRVEDNPEGLEFQVWDRGIKCLWVVLLISLFAWNIK